MLVFLFELLKVTLQQSTHGDDADDNSSPRRHPHHPPHSYHRQSRSSSQTPSQTYPQTRKLSIAQEERGKTYSAGMFPKTQR
jgi:hypothetical protein